ncbi:hypothetical protein GRAQ_00851 [Rahnella aquatilis CIP 78.65 = ATCC 33071]|uniref:Uncharacterized conserved small protein n=1 Tax=Rahnella aquatilis (strain ATCC 33071 / DSM 4594 / JCM 1683 / NBRC 105701 / NCIMB 13365 / CIP 78.65) TaxID=745277 RepID=H2IUP7_RAHAC|nr:DUF1127 domain-containing protein [Rahnella aquatilis]AEX51690.1 uncharacterized conserved small protein [Rahnella aquatilis CIP 78.65 = ATCC 33071]KFD16419.1 hypothetical protein GRAQ_00851 [Rahnella aquatilis CIP 78.65 = ATCC 33071]
MKNIIEERQFAGCETRVCDGIVMPERAVQMPQKKAGWVKQWFAVLYGWNERRISRKILHSLSADQLKDIGLAKSDIDREYPRSVWPNWPK